MNDEEDSGTAWNPIWSGSRSGPDWITYCDRHPVAVLLGMQTLGAGEDEMSFALATTPALNPNGAVHGGLLAAALDHALAVTAMLAMPDDGMPNTAGMNVHYLRPAMPTVELRTRVTRGGRTLIFAQADVFAGDGRLAATADGTFAVLSAEQVSMRDPVSTSARGSS